MNTKVQLVLLALLFAGGVLLGHLLTASSAGAKSAIEARADSLVGELRRQHEEEVAALRDSAAAAATRAKAAADSARAGERGRAASDAIADSLRRETATLDSALQRAATSADSVPLLVSKVGALEGELAHATSQVAEARASSDHWKAAYQDQFEASAALQGAVAKDSTRIIELEDTIKGLRQPARWSLRLGRWDVRVCAQYQVVRAGRVGAGPTVCRS